MLRRPWIASAFGLLSFLACGTGGDDHASASADLATGVDDARVVSAEQLETWQREIDEFGQGYRPTGSEAHEGYIRRLADHLRELQIGDVHTEPYSFTKWSPSSASLAIVDGPAAGPLVVSSHAPYSGSTPPEGITADLVTLTLPDAIAVDSGALSNVLHDPLSALSTAAGAVSEVIKARKDLKGKIVVFDVPSAILPPSLGAPVFANDPASTIPPKRAEAGLSALLAVPSIHETLALVGAIGAIAVVDGPEEEAQGLEAPFFGNLGPNVPIVYVSRETGRDLARDIASGAARRAKLVLDVSTEPATSENLIAVIPGLSRKEIIVGSHTDGPNSMEDNGPAGILAMATYLQGLPIEQRPRTVRIVLSGGHFAGSRGIKEYVKRHVLDLATNALVVMELEHLGALEWAETSPGKMGLTGRPEVQLVSTWSTKPLEAAGTTFCKQFDRCISSGPSLFGEGAYYVFVPLVQFITSPQYLLVGPKPEVTTQFTDYALMRRQVKAFLEMETTLARVSDSQLGVGSAL